MKRFVKRPIRASTQNLATERMFTPTDVVQLLSQIEELGDCQISLWDTTDGYIDFAIGKSIYRLSYTIPGGQP